MAVDQYTTFLALQNDAPNVYVAARMIELLERILVYRKCLLPIP